MNQEDINKNIGEAKEMIGEAKEVIGDKVGEAKEVIGSKVSELKENTENIINNMSVEEKVYTFYLFLVIICSVIGMLLTKYEILSTSTAKGAILGMMFGIVLSIYLWNMVGKKLVEKSSKK